MQILQSSSSYLKLRNIDAKKFYYGSAALALMVTFLNISYFIHNVISGDYHSSLFRTLPRSNDSFSSSSMESSKEKCGSYHAPLGVEGKDDSTIVTQSYLRKESNDELKIALLMSFPNSGTSYTLQNWRFTSDHVIAVNYCKEFGEDSVPAINNMLYSPYYSQKFVDQFNQSIPENYLMVKTHCAYYAADLLLSQLIVNNVNFRFGCLNVQSCNETEQVGDPALRKELRKHKEQAYLSRLRKTIHLFRDPFDNIIARFHLELKHLSEKNITFERSANGFRYYCQYMNDLLFEDTDIGMESHFDQKLYRSTIPCYHDFYRYVIWHNEAFKAIEHWGLSSYVLFYEDYETNRECAVNGLMEYLDISPVSEGSSFHPSTYVDYFTEEEKAAVKKFIFRYSSPLTLHHLHRYGISESLF